MARERMVTRTIVTREVYFKKYDIVTGKIMDDKMVFGVNVIIENNMQGVAKINEKLQSFGQKATCVMIEHIDDKETLYGMTEDDFIRQAKVLPPRTNNDEE